jgi:hypothetical protein
LRTGGGGFAGGSFTGSSPGLSPFLQLSNKKETAVIRKNTKTAEPILSFMSVVKFFYSELVNVRFKKKILNKKLAK